MNISTKFHIPARKLDFVNINLTNDNKLFIDPLLIKRGNTEFHKNCYKTIENFVSKLLLLAHQKQYTVLSEFINNMYERNETKLGYSQDTTYGKSFGENGGTDLIKLLSKNGILESGFVEDIFDCLIMIPNIGKDKVSDLITTIIFLNLVKYTQEQCAKWNIPTKLVKLSKLCWNSRIEKWEEREEVLPLYNEKPIVFVPKSFTDKNYIFSYEKLYRKIIIPLYKELELKNDESKFVIKYKNGRIHVLGNKLRETYPCTKYVVLDFVKKYDLVYREYKARIIGI